MAAYDVKKPSNRPKTSIFEKNPETGEKQWSDAAIRMADSQGGVIGKGIRANRYYREGKKRMQTSEREGKLKKLFGMGPEDFGKQIQDNRQLQQQRLKGTSAGFQRFQNHAARQVAAANAAGLPPSAVQQIQENANLQMSDMAQRYERQELDASNRNTSGLLGAFLGHDLGLQGLGIASRPLAVPQQDSGGILGRVFGTFGL